MDILSSPLQQVSAGPFWKKAMRITSFDYEVVAAILKNLSKLLSCGKFLNLDSSRMTSWQRSFPFVAYILVMFVVDQCR